MSRKRSEAALEALPRALPRRRRAANGVPRETAELVFGKILGFAAFGFPKSHAAAFGLLAYQSAWLRHHYPAEFLCALLNAQPMGFYPPASLVRDAQRHGVEVRPPDVKRSDAKCRIEGDAVRVGLGYIRGLGEDAGRGARGRAGAERAVHRRARSRAARAARPAGARGARRLGCVRRRSAGRGGSSSGGSASRRARSRPDRAARSASSRSRSSRRRRSPSCRADAVGADARRLPHDEPLGRRPSARAPARRTCRRRSLSSVELLELGAWRAGRVRRARRRAPAAGDRERASSSCSSRTSTGR